MSFALRVLAGSLWLASFVFPSPSAAQISSNMTLVGQVDQHLEYSDVWGYTDEFDNEYAILTTTLGTSIINVTNPATAYQTGFISGNFSIWRDPKVYQDYAYVVTEGGGGMQIISLVDPENPQLVATYNGFNSAHNLFIDESTGWAYACGVDLGVGGLHVVDLANPTSPDVVTNYNGSYVHDLYVENGRAYLAEIQSPSFRILDVSDFRAFNTIGGPITYPTAFTHNTWLTSGGFLLTTDENQGGHMRVWDISNLAQIQQVGSYQAPVTSSIIHNVLVDGERVYISYYSEGTRVVDVSDPTLPFEVGFYDSFGGASGGFDGVWGVYPYLPSGLVLASDIAEGLLIFDVQEDYGVVAGTATLDGVASGGVTVTLQGTTTSGETLADGRFAFAADPGTYTAEARAFGYGTLTQSVQVTQGGTVNANFALTAVPNGSLIGTLTGDDQNKAIVSLAGATVVLVGTPLTTLTDANGNYNFGQVPIGPHTLQIQRAGYGGTTRAVTVQQSANIEDIQLVASPFYDNADVDGSWSLAAPNDNAISGHWIQAVPVASGGGLVQPGNDASPDLTTGKCFVTGNGSPGGDIGEADIDGGRTILTTPAMDMSAVTDPIVAYSRWYVNEAGASPGSDVFNIRISEDGGNTWILLEALTNDATPWTRVNWRVRDFITDLTQVKLRFVAADNGSGSIVEAAIDDLEFYEGASGPTPVLTDTAPPAAQVRSIYPNPFNPTTRIQFELRHAGHARLDVVDARGRRVATLVDAELAPGGHVARWNGLDATGGRVSSGVYLAVLTTAEGRSMRKMVLAK